MSDIIKTDNAPLGKGPYVQGRKVGNFIYVSGQGPLDPATNEITGDTIQEQTRRTLDNIKAILEAGGATMKDVVKVSAFLQDLADFGAFNEVYKEYFPVDYPCRTTVGADLLNIMVEIDVVAYVK